MWINWRLRLTTVEFNHTNKRRTEKRNVLGEVVSVIDDENGRVEYAYDAQGNLTSTKVKKPSGAGPTSITTTISYDLLGRKTSVDDPNKGRWTYQYNQLGELTQQTNDNGHYSRMTYDGMGRMITRKDYYVGQGWESDTIWTYDNAPYTLGQLAHVRDLISGYVKLFSYDNLGRVSQTVTSLGVNFDLSLNGVDGDHYEKVTYDQHSRIFQVFDASRESATYTDNGVRYVYNNQGYLSAIQDAVVLNGTTREVYRLITAMDARGNVVNETLGNSVTRKHWFDGETNRIRGVHGTKFGGGDIQDLSYRWDTLGNLEQRRDRSGSKNLTENFTYDDLNRLKTSQVVGRSRKDVTYDSYGNIRSKTGVGTYSYSNARPNAVSAAGGVTYAYDDNGNNTSSSDGRVITYNSFDKVKSAAKGGHTTSFEYGPDRARYKRIDTKSGNTTTTLYIGSVEKITYPNNTRAIKRYIDGLVIKTLNYNSGRTLTSTDTHYTLSDHLGSVDVITSGSGAITQQLSYDAWGLRRNAVNWQDLAASSITNFNTDLTRRGFTGHEHMDEVGIIHMNGRIYDPRLGRFLQADPFVDNAYNTQAFNRYSYLGNNPLNGTDPTGFFSFREAFAIVFVIVVSVLTYGAASGWAAGTAWGGVPGVAGGAATVNIAGGIVAGAIAGAAGGFASGLIATGSIQGGLHGAAFGALSGAIFGGLGAGFGEGISLVKVLSFGVGGGISNLLQGGKFGHGFVSAAAFTLAGGASWLRNRGLAARTVINAAIAGTVSKVTGGKFANGAVTAAFATVVEGVAQAARRTGWFGGTPDVSIVSDVPNPAFHDLSTDIDIGALPARDYYSIPRSAAVRVVPEATTIDISYAATGGVDATFNRQMGLDGFLTPDIVPAHGLRSLAVDAITLPAMFVGGAGGVISGHAAYLGATGGLKQWIRPGRSFSHSLSKITYGIQWGASPHYAYKIGNPTLRRWNQRLRQMRIPGTRDAGHLHLWVRR